MRSKKQIIIIIFRATTTRKEAPSLLSRSIQRKTTAHVSASLRKRPARHPFWTHKAKKKKESDERDFRLLFPYKNRDISQRKKKLKLAP